MTRDPSTEGDLGPSITEYRPRGISRRAIRVFVALGAVALTVGLVLTLALDQPMAQCLVGWGALMLVIGLVLHLLGRSRQHLRVVVHENGLLYAKGGTESTFLWDEAIQVWQQIVTRKRQGYRATTHDYRIQLEDGREYRFNDAFVGIEALGKTIQTEVTRRLLPGAVAAFARGETQSFGDVTISKEGLAHGTDRLPWEQVEGVRIEGRSLTVRKEAKWFPWSTVEVSRVPNVYVLLALANQNTSLNQQT